MIEVQNFITIINISSSYMKSLRSYLIIQVSGRFEVLIRILVLITIKKPEDIGDRAESCARALLLIFLETRLGCYIDKFVIKVLVLGSWVTHLMRALPF